MVTFVVRKEINVEVPLLILRLIELVTPDVVQRFPLTDEVVLVFSYVILLLIPGVVVHEPVNVVRLRL